MFGGWSCALDKVLAERSLAAMLAAESPQVLLVRDAHAVRLEGVATPPECLLELRLS